MMPPLSPIQEAPSITRSGSTAGNSLGKSSQSSQRKPRPHSAARGGISNKYDDGRADDILALLGSPPDDSDTSRSKESPATSDLLLQNHNSNSATEAKKVRFAGSNSAHSPSSKVEPNDNGSNAGGTFPPEEITQEEEPRYGPSSASLGPKTASLPNTTSVGHQPRNQLQRPSSAVSAIFSSGNRRNTLLQNIDSDSSNNRGGDDRGYACDRRVGHNADYAVGPHSSSFATPADDHVIETLKRRHQDEISAIVANHREDLERMKAKGAGQAQTQVDAGLVKDAIAALHSAKTDLKSQQQKERDELRAERSRLESLQMSLQTERERLLDVQDDERTKLMSRLESLESERLEHAQCYRKQQIELQKSRDDLERGKLEFAIRVQDIEEKLERKRESLAQDKRLLIDSKENLAQERADFEESRRIARTELEGADALRRELAEVQSNINAEAARLNTLKEHLEYETKSLLEQETSIATRLLDAEKLEAKNIQTQKDIEERKVEHDRLSAKLQEREERLLFSSIDAMKSRYYLQQQHQPLHQGPNSTSSAATQQLQQHQYYAAEYSGHRPHFMYPPLSPKCMNANASAKK